MSGKNKNKRREMFNREKYYVDKEAWKKATTRRYLDRDVTDDEARKAYYAAHRKWDSRTSGSGNVYLTLLYALRAHMRGKVHCHDMDLDEQKEFLATAYPLLKRFLTKKEAPAVVLGNAPEAAAFA